MNESLNDAVVLIVDDNPRNLSVLFDALADYGMEMLAATSGAEAFKRLELVTPDLILLDVLMPDMDGFEVCQKLKADAKTAAIPIIFMTALSDTENLVKGFSLGAVDYITKPVRHDEALMRIKTHLTLQKLRRNLEEKNRELWNKNQELDQAVIRERELNQLKTRFISVASHEFRTPLSAILLLSEIIESFGQTLSPEQRKAKFDQIRYSIRQMTMLLDDVLALSRTELGSIPFQRQPVDLIAYFIEALRQFDEAWTAGHIIRFIRPDTPVVAQIDPNLFSHILSNLVSNAIKYSPAQSEIIVELTQTEAEVTIRVIDQGIGIPAADLPNLFTAFHRAGNVSGIKGTGLGLSIVKQFVDLHKGSIAVQSSLENGTTFTVIIPKKE